MKHPRALRIAVIGCGHFGHGHVRRFLDLESAELSALVDLDRSTLDRMRRRYPRVRVERDYRSVLDDPGIDAVVVAAPTATHARIASDALAAGKHVLVETPLCMTQWQAERLAQLAESHRRVLMVGQEFVFDGGLNTLRDLIAKGELGQIDYLDAVQSNFGSVHVGSSVLYDLGAQDIGICNYLLGKAPIAVSAIGAAVSHAAAQDVCFVTLQYEDGAFAHLGLSRLNPRKVRTLTAVGSIGTAHFDEIDPQNTLSIFDKGMEGQPHGGSFGEPPYPASRGDVRIPAIRRTDPMLGQAEAFVRWVLDGVECGCGVREGLDVVATLEAANRSMRLGGTTCLVGVAEEPRTSARSDGDLATARVHPHPVAAEQGGRITLKRAMADARSIPRLPVADPAEIERVRRRCGLQPTGASSVSPGACAAPGREVMLKEASAEVSAIPKPRMPEVTEIERVRRRCQAEPRHTVHV